MIENIASMVLGGMAAGMVLFIVSVGLSVTMGLMGFANLAHGAFAMIGGYAVVTLMAKLGAPFGVALEQDEPTIAADIQHNPPWAPLRQACRGAGFGACWLHPIQDAAGAPFGLVSVWPYIPTARKARGLSASSSRNASA